MFLYSLLSGVDFFYFRYAAVSISIIMRASLFFRSYSGNLPSMFRVISSSETKFAAIFCCWSYAILSFMSLLWLVMSEELGIRRLYVLKLYVSF